MFYDYRIQITDISLLQNTYHLCVVDLHNSYRILCFSIFFLSSCKRWNVRNTSVVDSGKKVLYHCNEVFKIYRVVFLTVPPKFQCEKEKRCSTNEDLLYIENFMEQNLWLAAHHFSFWYWKLGGTVKKIKYHRRWR